MFQKSENRPLIILVLTEIMTGLGFIGTFIGFAIGISSGVEIGLGYETKDALFEALGTGIFTSLYTTITGLSLALVNLIQFNMVPAKQGLCQKKDCCLEDKNCCDKQKCCKE